MNALGLLLLPLFAQAAPMPTAGWVDTLISQGPTGVVSAFLLYISYTLWNDNKFKQKMVDDLQAARLQDAKESSQKMLELSDKVHSTTERLADVLDRIEKNKP